MNTLFLENSTKQGLNYRPQRVEKKNGQKCNQKSKGRLEINT